MIPALTIAIPTYNRLGTLFLALDDLVPLVDEGLVSALVIVDGSSDGTYERIQSYARQGMEIVQNDGNQGYAATFCRIIRECDTEWVLVSADDDRIDRSRLPELQQWLQSERPDFVSTQWRTVDDVLYRGRRLSGAINPKELRPAAGHAPGLVYRVEAARSALPVLEVHLREGSSAAIAYPQVLVAAQLMAAGRASWWAGAVVREGSALPSGLSDAAGRSYWVPESRVSQVVDFDRFFAQGHAAAPDRRSRQLFRRWRRINGVALYPAIQTLVREAAPSVDDEWLDAGVRRFLRRKRWKQSIMGVPGVRSVLDRRR